jgi:hypothetical protein
MVEVKGTLDELYTIFGEAAKGEAKKIARRAGKKTVRKGAKVATSAWGRFQKSFKFRKKRKSEKNTSYLAARSKACSRAWKKKKKGK